MHILTIYWLYIVHRIHLTLCQPYRDANNNRCTDNKKLGRIDSHFNICGILELLVIMNSSNYSRLLFVVGICQNEFFFIEKKKKIKLTHTHMNDDLKCTTVIDQMAITMASIIVFICLILKKKKPLFPSQISNSTNTFHILVDLPSIDQLHRVSYILRSM